MIKPGDIVRALLPGVSETKNRPAVVISTEAYQLILWQMQAEKLEAAAALLPSYQLILWQMQSCRNQHCT